MGTIVVTTRVTTILPIRAECSVEVIRFTPLGKARQGRGLVSRLCLESPSFKLVGLMLNKDWNFYVRIALDGGIHGFPDIPMLRADLLVSSTLIQVMRRSFFA